ncbi:hypothetical protein O4J56_07565 [Nocardiopsis sp. RSe5-2]|uniref:Ferritin-like domain-containing protein n=1 Tax=Nocardiopsis endophytica TaxID=3018445 RepID=A0ABT4U0K8_9ACTN|nr:hypothetical protein [Nocardiopsis endophytica]MDA2810491.1 hypothetical protein [Nocardiopsis endophytica]
MGARGGTAGTSVTRRTVLAAALVAAAASGCQGARWYPSEVGPDERVLRGAIADKERLIARYRAALGADEGPADLLETFLAHHEDHLATLRGRLPDTGRHTREDPDASPSPSPSPVDGGPVDAAGLRTAEEAAADSRARQCGDVQDPALVQLLASIGACEIGHAHMLGEEVG